MENLINLINKIHKIGINIDDLSNVYSLEKLPKNKHITDIGDIEKNYYFIISGIVRTYCIKNSGEEINMNFYAENGFITSYNSLTKQEPARVGIQCLEDTSYVKINKEKLDVLADKFPQLNKFIFENIMSVVDQILTIRIDELCLTPKERYINLINDYPYIKKVPIKHLALYLGIHPNSLSRIRKDLQISTKKP